MPPLDFLYHYTSLPAFMGILDQHALRATHIRYLNDFSEQLIMWELIDQIIDEQRANASGE